MSRIGPYNVDIPALQNYKCCIRRTASVYQLSKHMLTYTDIHTHTHISQIQYLSVDSWIWNKSISISGKTHTCKRQEIKDTTEYTMQK